MRTSLLLLIATAAISSASAQRIDISTGRTDLILNVADNGRLYQSYLGDRLLNSPDRERISKRLQGETYPGSGAEDYYEPALAVTHADGNLTTILKYVSHTQKDTPYGSCTEITLSDDAYPVDVKLNYLAYADENVITTWTEITNRGKKPVEIWRYASAMLYFDRGEYYLTEFASDWAKEAQMRTQQLQFGKKVVDTKLGSRAAMFAHPFFMLGLDAPAAENSGDVLMGTIGWTGNFQFTFEVDHNGALRVMPSINPYASTWQLQPGETFTTPEFVFTLSTTGTGDGSRSIHDWARRYQLKDGMADRMTLLNNWENTYFNFDEQLLAELMKEAKELGVDMFLLDDGWFGNKYPRKDDRAGLGDWEATHAKLPGGIKALTSSANDAGVKFGIWIEPEMVNPKSELFEKHPDWAYTLPNREPYYFRNQLVIDLNRPEVQEHVFNVVDTILSNNPDVAYFKWDCNSPITNIYSHYLKDKQQQLYIGHVRGLYKVLARIKDKYPDVPMMLCSGGGARCDYEALKYFTEFWCSDNTDPIERLFIQWGFSHFFPAKAMSAHVTNWNKNASVKFRTDVASMGKLGFDIGLSGLSDAELQYMQEAIKNWNRLKPVILEGDQYRLVSPYSGNHTATSYVAKDQGHAVLFAFDIYPRYGEKIMPVKLQGLNPMRQYSVREINKMPKANENSDTSNTESATIATYSGDYLMKVGLDAFSGSALHSRVFEIEAL